MRDLSNAPSGMFGSLFDNVCEQNVTYNLFFLLFYCTVVDCVPVGPKVGGGEGSTTVQGIW